MRRQYDRGQNGDDHELGVAHPQYLPHQQVLQIFAAMRVAGEQQDAERCGQHEHRPNDGFLDFRPAFLGPGQEQRTEQGSRQRGNLHGDALRFPTEEVGCNDADPGNLRNGDVDEYDAPVQHLDSQWSMGCGNQQARDQCGEQEAELEVGHVIFSPL